MNEILRIDGLSLRDEDKMLLDSVSIGLMPSQTIAFIGESGSGKTMTLKSILSLLPRDVSKTSGTVLLDGSDIYSLSPKERRRLLGTTLGFVPQNTVNYLHPLLRVADQMTDGFINFNGRRMRKEALRKAGSLLERVGIADPERVLSSYPSELSGGMRQRVNIAAALMMDPPLLLSDEPTSALDRIVQMQVADLYLSLLEERKLSLVLVSHDLVFVKRIADLVAVFYSGHVVEQGTKEEIFSEPMHPYTKALIALTPTLEQDKTKPLEEIKGYISEDDRRRSGCPFAPRCPHARPACMERIRTVSVSPSHSVSCILAEEVHHGS